MAWSLFYDGGCNLCHTSRLRAEDWAEAAGVPLVAHPLQSPEAAKKGYGGDAMILEADDGVYVGADAWLKLMSLAPGYLRWIYPLRRVPLLRQLLAWGYGIVARHRIKWFGSRECKLPTSTGS